MQDTQELALPETCTIKRRVLVPDEVGGYSETWTDLATSVACRLSPASLSTEQVVADRFRGQALWNLTLPYDQDIATDDRVVLGGDTYEVAGLARGGAWRTATRVLVVRCG